MFLGGNRAVRRGLARLTTTVLAVSAAVAVPALAAPSAAVAPRIATAADLALRPSDYTTPDKIYPLEAQALGPEHAREHLAARNLARRLAAEHLVVPTRQIPTTNLPPGQVGQWSDPFVPDGTDEDALGVHAVLLHTGKVLLWSGYYDDGDGGGLESYAYVWDPATGQATEVDPPHDIFCSGMVVLQDGTVLAVGGVFSQDRPRPGALYVVRFDPVTMTWSEEPPTALGRYYPTVTELPSGRALITSGNTIAGVRNPTIELYTPGAGGAAGSIRTVPSAAAPMSYYPHQYVLPDGNVLIVQTQVTSILNTETWQLEPLRKLGLSRSGNPASVMPLEAPGQAETKVLMIGGLHGGHGAATATTEEFDDDDPTAGWQPKASMPQPRAHMNVVSLPDGTILGVGGNSTSMFADPQRSTLLYTPWTDTWTTLASQQLRRAYHSTALLLPDGRVLSAGDTGPGGGGRQLEVYSPPYLFHGPRPVTTTPAPDQVDWDQQVVLRTDRPVSHAVLVHPSAVTHANDMSGHLIVLPTRTNADGSTTVRMPANSRRAQPGYWMLYVVDSSGTPSVASWVHLGPQYFTEH